jgi:hypothetical protein
MNMDCKLDLKTIALHAKNVKYNLKIDFFMWLGYCIFFVILCHVINNELFNIDFSLHLSSQPLTMPFIPC